MGRACSMSGSVGGGEMVDARQLVSVRKFLAHGFGPRKFGVFVPIVPLKFDPVFAGNGFPGLGYRVASEEGYQCLGDIATSCCIGQHETSVPQL